MTFRSVDSADAANSLTDEEFKPKTGALPTNERPLMTDYPTHHQKPIVIDYDYNDGYKAVGYVMGLNSVTDCWDTTKHVIDAPLREILTSKTLGAEQAHEKATLDQPATMGYKHVRPYQDYACRLFGPALKRVYDNFARAWNHYAPDTHRMPELATIPSNIQKVPGNPNHAVQIVRTHPRDKDKTIKEPYIHASSWARNSIYMENHVFLLSDLCPEVKGNTTKTLEGMGREGRKAE